MNISLNNLDKKDNKNLKKVADYLLYTLPLLATALMTIPLPDNTKLWLIFGINIIVIGFKGITKFSADENTSSTNI